MKGKLNVGIIGCGYWGPNLVRNFINNPHCSHIIVADLRIERLNFIKEKYPELIVTTDAVEVITNPDIDAVVIATPVNTHKDLALESIRNGKHVFIEKPLADNLKSADEILEYANIYNRILSVGHIFQFAPAVTAIKQEIQNNLLGQIFHFSSQRINLGPPGTTVDVVWDLGPHDLSILLYLYDESPSYVYAFGNSYWWNGIIDNAEIFLKFPSNRTAHIHLSWLSSKKIRKTFIFGDKGNLEYDETLNPEKRVVFYDRGIDNRIIQKDGEIKNLQYGMGEIKNISLPAGEPLALEIDSFIDSIINNYQPINNGKIGREVVSILEEISNSIKVNG